ncbi:MAG: hypothetical protein ABIU95_00935 [Burkholderiales bacterium]
MGKQFFVTLLATAGITSASAFAQVSAEQLAGTWECFGPGQTSARTPPILHFGGGEDSLQVDGFSRTVLGIATIAADAGTTRVSPATGSALFITGFSDAGKNASMQVRREDGGNYRCYRLPRYDNVMIPRIREVEEKN